MRVAVILAILLVGLPSAWADEPVAKSAALLTQADATFRSGKYAEATAIYKQAILAAEAEKATETLVEALAMAARGHLTRDEGKAGQPYLRRAAKLASADAPLGWSRFLGVRGRFEWKFEKDKPKATKTFEAMYAYGVKHKLWSRAVDAAHMVAITGTLEQQVTWAAKGITAAEEGKLDSWLGPLWNNLGNTHQERGEHEKALAAWLKARAYHWKGTSEHRKLVADWAVGMGYRYCGKFREAKAWLRPVLAWAERRYTEKKEPERGEWIGLACLELGLIAIKEKRVEAARADLKRAYTFLKEAKMAEWHPALWKELMEGLATVRHSEDEVRMQIENFGAAIDMFKMENKRLPPDLQALTKTSGRNPHPLLSRIPVDAWGNDYEYKALSSNEYEIRSYGPDGLPDTDDDIVGPKP